jgi:hypothetical protein
MMMRVVRSTADVAIRSIAVTSAASASASRSCESTAPAAIAAATTARAEKERRGEKALRKAAEGMRRRTVEGGGREATATRPTPPLVVTQGARLHPTRSPQEEEEA